MTATSSFLNDPFGFARAEVILPRSGTADTSSMKAKVVNPDLTLYSVKGENRVLYAHLEPADKGNAFDVIFSHAKLSGDWFATYWLPWYQNSTYRITLKPGGASPGADMFFTAALTGCTVHVDGDPWEPTVYHSNARDLPVIVPLEKAHTSDHYIMSRKVVHMADAIRASQAKFAKGPSHYTPQSATVFDYAREVVSSSSVDILRREFEEKLQAEKDSVLPTIGGTVFGIRSKSHGLWTFYYQSWTLIVYSKGDQRLRRYIVNHCRRFWPDTDISKPIPITIEASDDDEET